MDSTFYFLRKTAWFLVAAGFVALVLLLCRSCLNRGAVSRVPVVTPVVVPSSLVLNHGSVKYQVQKNDTLIGVLKKSGILRKGGLARTVRMNPQLKKNGDLIFPGTWIELPQVAKATQRKPSSVSVPVSTHPFSVLLATPFISNSRIDSTDVSTGGTATAGSYLNYGIKMDWTQKWSQRFETSLFFRGEASQFYINDPVRVLDHSQTFLGEFGVSGLLSVSRAIGVGINLGIKQHPFIRAESLFANTVDTVAVPEAGIFSRQKIISISPLSLSTEEFGNFLFPVSQSSYRVNSGVSLGAKAEITHDLSSFQIRGGVFYELTLQNTSISNQSFQELGAYIGVSLSLFKQVELSRDGPSGVRK